jgi:hypothetical protein
MNTVIGSECTKESMFGVIGGWTSQFEVDGKLVGGHLRLDQDARVSWALEKMDIVGYRILELGPLEGAHTKMIEEAGAEEIISIEGLSDCFLRCLIVKEAFQLTRTKFLFGDFCDYIPKYSGDDFDLVVALGVLYHQSNPAKLIHDLAKITDNVIVWSQVANTEHPGKEESSVMANGERYFGKTMYWGDTRLKKEDYCASLQTEAFWMYADEMKRCFRNAGFCDIVEKKCDPTPHGDCLLFIAHKP